MILYDSLISAPNSLSRVQVHPVNTAWQNVANRR